MKHSNNSISHEAVDDAPDDSSLKRNLKNRHIQLIAIGGAIGTGLFMGSGKTISVSGTSIIFTYAIIGFFMFFVMRAMGEILLSDLKHKTFTDFCTQYIGQWAGYFIGWSYWLAWVVVAIADCTVISSYMKFWFPDIPTWGPAFSVLAIMFALNMFAVKMFGEVEFWFALIKVVAIIALIVTGVVMISLSVTSPQGVVASLSHLTEDGVVFPYGISGFFAGFQIAIFSFAGVELIGTTAAESHDPHKTLPKAINSVPVRVIIFYVLALGCIISVSSWAKINIDQSPFVQVFLIAGLPAAAGMINLVVLTSAMSAANSGVFATSRMLYSLSGKGQAPKLFRVLSNSSIPMRGLVFSCLCMGAGLVILFIIPEVMKAFTVLTTISAILFIFAWAMIVVAYIRYRKIDPQLHIASRFKMPGGLLMPWLVLAFFAFVIVLLALEPDTLHAMLCMPIWFAILALAYRRKGKAVQLASETSVS
ncbi:amino acid permease [Pantoea sp. Ap-967]|uniref:amino acid permease n=1 Tax=Pantoea sp. Ap-967 TaxID=2608362 RepID=UPI001422C3A2|nr:amino acid permease [Pantoea sp. Ap-967]NIE77145.1 amino acid permease [Pantoea sp. Ap-967]